MQKQPSKKLLMTGIVGSIVAVICCFTPILVIFLGTLGLSAAVVYLDMVLLPALFIFAGITIYALSKRKQNCCGENSPNVKENLK